MASGAVGNANPFPPEDDARVHDIKITGIDKQGITQPRGEGRGGALYSVPFTLSERPPEEWADFFVEFWNHPESYTTLHRPGIARVVGNTIVLNGTTMDDIEKAHKSVLEAAVKRANAAYRQWAEERDKRAAEKAEREAQHRRDVEAAADRMKFEDK